MAITIKLRSRFPVNGTPGMYEPDAISAVEDGCAALKRCSEIFEKLLQGAFFPVAQEPRKRP